MCVVVWALVCIHLTLEEWEENIHLTLQHGPFISKVLTEVNVLIVKVSEGKVTLPTEECIRDMQRKCP